jgi:hypothetical protein
MKRGFSSLALRRDNSAAHSLSEDRTMSVLAERLTTLQVSEPQEAGGLQVFGLFWQQPTPLSYTTLDEGLARGQLEVTEVSDGGSVPSLKVANKGDTMAFLMAGEQLSGGKQNRVLNASILIAAHSELPIPVSCVERGRWAYRSAQFGSAGSSSHSKLRRLMHTHATESYRREGKPSSRQGEVWQEVDRKLSETGSHSHTDMLQQAYEDTQVVLADVLQHLRVPEGACGAVFAYGGRIVGFDLFDQPATLARLWPKLVRAYALDAHAARQEGVPPLTVADVRNWLGAAPQAREEMFKSPGVGDDVRLESQHLVGAGLLVDGNPVHVEAFADAAS